MGRRAAFTAIAVGVLAVVAGCGGQDKQIGQGAASVVFENDGADTISVEVQWDDETGQRRHRSFDLDGLSRTELHLADRSWYRVILETQCKVDEWGSEQAEENEQADPGPAEAGPGGVDGVP